MSGRWSRFKLRKNAQDVDRSTRWMVRHAATRVPFYREAFSRAGIGADAIRGAADLPKLPMARRDELLSSGTEGFLHQGARRERLACHRTTGTTGTPVSVYMSRAEVLFRKASLLDAYRRNVRLPLSFTLVDVGAVRMSPADRSVQQVGPVKVVRLFRSAPTPENLALLRDVRPELVEGRPSMLWKLAQELETQPAITIRPRLVISRAEVLYPRVRELLQRTFACRVADYYNCEEAGNLAWECPDRLGVMHPNPATVFLEVVDADGQPVPYGVEGSVVITNLFNATMPFVRYPMGDRAALLEPGRCSCGFEGPAMRLVDGRDEDFFVLPDGREVSPRVVFDVIDAAIPEDEMGGALAQAIRGFQIVQEARDRIVILVVPGPRYSDSLWRRLPDGVRTLHPDVRVDVVCVDALEPGPGGKFRQVTSRVSSSWHPSGKDGSA